MHAAYSAFDTLRFSVKSSKCAQWNEYPRGKLENGALGRSFETLSPADITVATQNAVSCKASQPAMERPLLASELLDNSPSAATLLAFREQYLISCFEFHCYHSHQHRRSPDPGLNICNKPISKLQQMFYRHNGSALWIILGLVAIANRRLVFHQWESSKLA